jgi:hypothetical protein
LIVLVALLYPGVNILPELSLLLFVKKVLPEASCILPALILPFAGIIQLLEASTLQYSGQVFAIGGHTFSILAFFKTVHLQHKAMFKYQ